MVEAARLRVGEEARLCGLGAALLLPDEGRRCLNRQVKLRCGGALLAGPPPWRTQQPLPLHGNSRSRRSNRVPTSARGRVGTPPPASSKKARVRAATAAAGANTSSSSSSSTNISRPAQHGVAFHAGCAVTGASVSSTAHRHTLYST